MGKAEYLGRWSGWAGSAVTVSPFISVCSDGVCAEHQTGAFQNQHLERTGQDITLFIKADFSLSYDLPSQISHLIIHFLGRGHQRSSQELVSTNWAVCLQRSGE